MSRWLDAALDEHKTVIKHYKFTELLVKLFIALFDPELYSKKMVKSLRKDLDNYLDGVSNSTEDKVLRNMY